MLRVIRLATAVAFAMVALATLTEAEFCLWCDPVLSKNFLLCLNGKIINDARFSASVEDLDDMKNSMIAASTAMKKSSESTKMNMMNGAMAGELAELIKSQPSVGNLKETTSYLLGIVRECYVQTSGQPHYSFLKDIGKTVNSLLEDDSPSYDDSPLYDGSPSYYDSKPVPLQSPKVLAGSAVYNPQNINIPNNNAQQQIPSDSKNFISNQMYAPPQSGITLEENLAYPQTGLRYPAESANSKVKTSAFSFNYPSGNQNNGPFIRAAPNNQFLSTQNNVVNRYDSFQQNNRPNTEPEQNNWPNFVPYINAPQNNAANKGANFISPDRLLPQNTAPISNAVSSSVAQNINIARPWNTLGAKFPNIGPDPFLPQNTAPISNAVSSSAAQNINIARPWNTLGAKFPNIGPDQFLPQSNEPVSNAAPNYNFDNRRNAQNFIPQPALQQSSSAVSTFTSQDKGYPPNYPQNQLVQNFNLNKGALGQNGASPLNNVNNSPDPITAGDSSDYEYQPDYNYYSYYPASSDTYDYNSNQPSQPASQNLNWNYPAPSGVNNYPLPNNVFNPMNIVQSNQKSEPKQNYDDQPSQDLPQNSFSSALPLVKSVVQGADSGEIGYLSDGFQPYNFAAAEPPKGNGKNPVSQAESESKGKWTILPSKAKSGAQKSSSDESDDIAKAMRFAETIYVLCSQSQKFKSVFNKRISSNKAASYTYKLIRGALKDCGYLENAEEIAKSCSDAIKSLPQKCPFIQYGEAISKSLMDEFYTRELIGQNPEDQAKSITTAFLARLKRKKSPGSEKLTNKSSTGSIASTSGDSSSDYPTDGTNDRSQSSEYQYYQDYPKVTDDITNENYGDYPYYDELSEQGSGDKNYNNDDSIGKQDSAIIDDDYYDYYNYPNPTTDFQYPIKINQPKAIQTAQKTGNSKEKSLAGRVPNTDYNYQMYGDYPNYQTNNDQNQKYKGKILSKNPKYDYSNQNYNYNPNYDYYNPNDYYNYYGNYDNPNAKPNKQSSKQDDYYYQYGYYNPSNDNSLPVVQQRKKDNADDGIKLENAITESPDDYSDTTTVEYTDYSQTYPDYGITLKKNDIQLENTELPDSTNNEGSKKLISETALSNPYDEKAERKNRLNILMKWTLSSISDGKFNYKVYSNVISALAKYLQKTHPELGSQKCFITILIESLVACTQLLTGIPKEYLPKINVPDYTDTADETIASWSTNSLKQESQDKQSDQRNSAQNVQAYEVPQESTWKNGYQMSQANAPPSVLYNNAAQSGYGNSFTDMNVNIPIANEGGWVSNVPQSGGGVQAAPSQEYKDLSQQNNWNNNYQLNQGNSFFPGQNSMQQGYGNQLPDTNLNMQFSRQDSQIPTVPQSGESFIAPSQNGYIGLPQQNNWNYDYQSNQGNSFQPELINNKQGYSNRYLDSNFNGQLAGQGR